jgi:hypothetical protein
VIERPGFERLAYDIDRLVKRVWSLERRFRDQALVRFFADLEDVQDRTDEHAPLTPGDVWGLNPDGEWDIITPEGEGGGPGAYASMSVAGLWDGSAVSGDRIEWNLATSGYELSLINSGSYPGIVRGISVTEPGIYLVEASVTATMAGGSGDLFVLAAMENGAGGSWQMGAGDSDDCRPAIVVSDTGTDGASVSQLMPLGDGTSAYIDIDLGSGVTDCAWRLQVALMHPADVLTGSCAA